MKPNLSFLRKVAAGKVYPYASYSARTGRVDKFIGGEATTRKHAEAGLVHIRWPAHTLARGAVTLTEAGRSALSAPNA